MKEELIVEIDDLEYDDSIDNIFVNTCYEGKPFTGTAIENGEDGSYEEWHFINGFGEGRGFSRYPNGQLQEEFFLVHGETVSEKEWTEDGTLVLNHSEDPYFRQEFYKTGIMKAEETKEHRRTWYSEGKLKSDFVYANGYEIRYAKDGTWISKLHGKGPWLTLSRECLEINEEYISENYLKLFSEDRRFLHYFLLWLPEKPESCDYIPPQWVSNVICTMISSEDLHIKNEGIILSWNYWVMDAIPLLEKEKKNRKKPKDIFEDDYNVGFTRTIGQQAKAALETLNGR